MLEKRRAEVKNAEHRKPGNSASGLNGPVIIIWFLIINLILNGIAESQYIIVDISETNVCDILNTLRRVNWTFPLPRCKKYICKKKILRYKKNAIRK